MHLSGCRTKMIGYDYACREVLENDQHLQRQ